MVARLAQRFHLKNSHWLVQGIYSTNQSKLDRVKFRFVVSEIPKSENLILTPFFFFKLTHYITEQTQLIVIMSDDDDNMTNDEETDDA